MTDELTVRVPATTANLGPGFDTLGMALEVHSALTVSRGPTYGVQIEGEGAEGISRGRDNIAFRAICAVFEKVDRPVPVLRLRIQNAIPLARGLGSSAAAVVAGLVAGNALCGDPLSADDLLALGLALEGHPDNVAPALLGGCIASAVHNGRVVYGRVPVPEGIGAALFVPDFQMPTGEARAILPDPVSRANAVFNLSRVALLVTSLFSGQLELLRVATEDRLHQIARQEIFPAMPQLFQAALEADALCAFLSGAGSTVIALCQGNEDMVAEAMAKAAEEIDLSGRALVTRPSVEGATVVP